MATAAAHLGGERQGDSQSLRQVALASFIGTTIEWYDFFLYGTAAALVFSELFFPNVDPLDRHARRVRAPSRSASSRARSAASSSATSATASGASRCSCISLMIMGLATSLIGLLPTYAAIGVAAPILLVVLRFVQGFGVGGEWGGAVLMAVEHAPNGQARLLRQLRRRWACRPACLLSTVDLRRSCSALDDRAQFLAWGWRVPFLLSDRAHRRRPVHPPAAHGVAGVQRVKETRHARRRSRSSTPSGPSRAMCCSRWACGSRRTGSSTSTRCSS